MTKIDVSECKYINCCCYENGKCLWTKRYYENNIVPDCEKVKDCYYKRMKRLEQKLEKIKELCQVPNEPYYNSECEFGKGRIDLGQEILEIIRGAER